MKTRAVVMLIEHRRRLLLGKKLDIAGHPLSGQWHIPGGRVETGETDEAAIKREALEETGLAVASVELLVESEYYGRMLACYICRPVEPQTKPQAGDDLAAVEFVSLDQVAARCSPAAQAAWPPAVYGYIDQTTMSG